MSIENLHTEENLPSGTQDPNYWKKHYIIEADAEEIERNIRTTRFVSNDKSYDLIYFERGKAAPNILISQGSGGHAYIFVELAYLIHLRGFNVFIMPKHGGHTIRELVERHRAPLNHLLTNFSDKIGVFAEGLGGYAIFYLALDRGRLKSMVLENAPAILTEKDFHDNMLRGKEGAAERRRQLLPVMRMLVKLFPWIKLRISTYLDFEELVDTKKENRKIEESMVSSFDADPDFDKRYPLSAIMSLVTTPPPRPISALSVPTMFLVPVRDSFQHTLKSCSTGFPQ